ncbi:GTP cyclohydrolase II [Georgenia halophila]|uniref:GTP cyclohydrolase-2 n=1 Tax=Georgenia halophila TaxID=620889 RepID=A0ABP8LBS1_9MICO
MTDLHGLGVRRTVATTLPTAHGTFQMYGYDGAGGLGHVALVMGDVDSSKGEAPLVRVHSECLTGDALGSRRCDCGEQLQAALAEIAREERGALVYARGHEGRGIGLLAKLRAYALQDAGLDTVDANLELGYPADARTYEEVADILHDLGATRVRLLSSNPEKAERLDDLGVEVISRHILAVADRPENAFYLDTKRRRMRHDPIAALPDPWTQMLTGHVPAYAAAGTDATLVDRYGPLVATGAPLTIAQLGQSMDGFIAARSGDAEFVTGEQDRTHLHRLRALVDAVVVGGATVSADDPRLTVRAVPGANPVRVVLDPAGRVTREATVFTDGEAPTLWVVGPDASAETPAGHVKVLRLPVRAAGGRAGFDPAAVLAALRERGLGRVLVEGGGRLVSDFLAAGVLDRLFLTTAPLLIGDGVPGIRFDGSDRLAEAIGAPVRRFVLGQDICTEFDLAARG